MDFTVPGDYLPTRPRWRFRNRDGGAAFQLPVQWRPEAGRRWLDLGTPQNPPPFPLFDRLALTPSSLELHAFRSRDKRQAIKPALAVPVGGSAAPVADLFPGAGAWLGGKAPYRGELVENTVGERAESATLRFHHWRVKVKATSADPERQFSITLDFVSGLGLRLYQGELHGSFFSYEGLLAIDGTWLLPAQQLTMTLVQDGPLVAGHFERAGATGEVVGFFDGEVFHFDWRMPDTGSSGAAELTLSDDGKSLSGSVGLLDPKTKWTFERPPAPPPPAPFVDPLAFLRGVHFSRPRPGGAPYEQEWVRRKYKESWDRFWVHQGKPEGKDWFKPSLPIVLPPKKPR